MAYAEGTEVPIEKTKAELETLLRKAGAQGFISGWDDEAKLSRIHCKLSGFYVRFEVKTPQVKDFVRDRRGHQRPNGEAQRACEAEDRRRWRALLLIVKAKLELISNGERRVEQEFLADIVLPDSTTVGDTLLAQLKEAYSVGTMPRLLPG